MQKHSASAGRDAITSPLAGLQPGCRPLSPPPGPAVGPPRTVDAAASEHVDGQAKVVVQGQPLVLRQHAGPALQGGGGGRVGCMGGRQRREHRRSFEWTGCRARLGAGTHPPHLAAGGAQLAALVNPLALPVAVHCGGRGGRRQAVGGRGRLGGDAPHGLAAPLARAVGQVQRRAQELHSGAGGFLPHNCARSAAPSSPAPEVDEVQPTRKQCRSTCHAPPRPGQQHPCMSPRPRAPAHPRWRRCSPPRRTAPRPRSAPARG